MFNRSTMVFALLLALVLTGTAAADRYPQESEDGLQLIEINGIDAAYWREGASLSGYDKVMISDVDVSFRKNWQRDQNISRVALNNRVTSADMANIRAAVAEGFTQVFIEQLEEAGYSVVDTPGEDVLALVPAIVDLNVHAPDLSMRQAGMSRTYTTSAGEMTLNMAFYDSDTNSLIGRIIDERRAIDTGRLQWSNSITNRQEANIIFRSWASRLVRALDESREN